MVSVSIDKEFQMAKGKWQNSNWNIHLPFEIPLCDAQPAPQGNLQLGHFAMIGFVIVAQQMQEAMQDKPAHLIQGRVSFSTRVSPRCVDGNYDIAEEVLEFHRGALLSAPAGMPGSCTLASCSRPKRPLPSIPRK
jgi:hypothetical protein